MRRLEEVFGETRFLGATRGLKREEDRLWMIAEHVEDDEVAVAFLSLKTSNLLLTPRRLLELKPHLDIQGMWNVLRFEGYEVASEVALPAIQHLDLEQSSRGGSTLRMRTEDGEVSWLLPSSGSAEHPEENARAFVEALRRLL